MNIDKIKLPKGKDRRCKLNDSERDEIKSMHKGGFPIRAIARKFEDKCSRRLIQFILFPERLKQANTNHNWKNYYNTEKNRQYMRNHRAYKRNVLKIYFAQLKGGENNDRIWND